MSVVDRSSSSTTSDQLNDHAVLASMQLLIVGKYHRCPSKDMYLVRLQKQVV